MTKVSTLIRQMAKEGHKLASLEKASVLSASDDPKDQDKAREIRTRHDYESLKKQISSKKKPSKPAVKEEVIDERLGGKGYSRKATKGGGDWPDSDRGAGNKAKKRAGGKVEKKSPTYLAHVHNKEEVEIDETVGGGVPLTPQELEIQKKMSKLNVRLAKKRSQQMQKAKIKDTETSPEQVKEAKVDKGRSDYGKATIRNWRHSGPSTVEPAMFDPENKRGKTIEKRREEHKARRGVKGAKVPAYKVSEGEDRAFNLVRDKLKKKYGDGVLTTGEKPKPPTAKQKAEYAAHKAKLAKQDHRDPTEKASDGRYSDRHSNRGSD